MVDRLNSSHCVLRPVETLDRARSFLRDRLGLTELMTRPGLACFDLAGVPLILRETGQREEAAPLYFGVEDIQTAHQTLRGRGVIFLRGPHLRDLLPDGSEEWVALFADDEGRPLALHAVTPARDRAN